jgi:hypothetical protein
MRCSVESRGVVWKVVCAALAGLAVLYGGTVRAQRAHNADLYIRGAVGPAHASSNATSLISSEEAELAGEGIEYSIAMGGITVPNLAAHVTFFGWTTFSPDPKYDHTELNLGTSMTMFAWGAGLTWIVMPLNLYVSVSPAFAQLKTKGPDIGSSTSDRGWAIEGSVGKEWWFSETWAWGLALGGGYHSARGAASSDRRWKGWSTSLRLSITMN